MNKQAHLSPVEIQQINGILSRVSGQEGILIPVLQEVQDALGYLSEASLEYLANQLRMPLSSIYGVATFYSQFRLEPRGENIIRVCSGTACHVRGASTVLKTLKEQLGIDSGETTNDLKFTLEEVACIGACGLAPAMMINDKTYGRLTKQKVLAVLSEFNHKTNSPIREEE